MPRNPTDISLESLERRRAPALARALSLVRDGRFDEAERTVLDVEPSIHGAVALGRLYTDELRRLAVSASRSTRPHAEAVFRRALHWRRSAYPEPHTQVEADAYATGRAEDLAELVAIFGSDPTAAI
jgi:hypothetical protein